MPTAGSGKSQIYLTLPTYQFIANGFYQGPWGVNFGGNFVVREGYTQMFYARRCRTNDPVYSTKDILVIAGKHRQVPPAGREVARRARREAVHASARTQIALRRRRLQRC